VRVALSQPGNTLGSMAIAGTIFGRLPVPAAQVRQDGTFEFTGVLPSVYRFTATVPAPAGWWLRSAMLGNRELADLPLEVSGDGDLSGLVVLFSNRQTELTGMLQTPAGTPAVDYYVVVFPADRTLWRPQGRRLVSTRPASDGRFIVRDLPAGDYRIAALTDFDPDDWQTAEFLDQLVPASVAVSLGEGERKVQDLRIAR
jgi:hypothetical protein